MSKGKSVNKRVSGRMTKTGSHACHAGHLVILKRVVAPHGEKQLKMDYMTLRQEDMQINGGA